MPNTQVIIQSSLQSSTGLPKDQFENVWHFLDTTGASPAEVALTGCTKIQDFWTGATGLSGIGAPAVNLAADVGDLMTLICYDFAAAKPRPELGRYTFTFEPGSSVALPEEVALCMSYFTARNLPSERGRLYLGPLNADALTGTNPSRPNTNFTRAVQAGGIRLVAIGVPATLPSFTTNTLGTDTANDTTAWALYSPKLGTFAAIEHGWVDDEWDGQRRRRVEASTRLTW